MGHGVPTHMCGSDPASRAQQAAIDGLEAQPKAAKELDFAVVCVLQCDTYPAIQQIQLVATTWHHCRRHLSAVGANKHAHSCTGWVAWMLHLQRADKEPAHGSWVETGIAVRAAAEEAKRKNASGAGPGLLVRALGPIATLGTPPLTPPLVVCASTHKKRVMPQLLESKRSWTCGGSVCCRG